jgi:hypothetical protein
MIQSKAACLGRIASSVGLILLTVSAANAQVSATFYHIPVSDGGPPYATAFSTTPYCSTSVLGLPTGFEVQFGSATDRAHISALCPGTTASDFEHNFAVHFSGSLTAPAAGNYTVFLSSDDGSVFKVNGVTYLDNWVAQAYGPGDIPNIGLHAGMNPFVLDYFENSYGGAFVSLQVRDGVVLQPDVVPEPASMVLFATGLIGVFGIVHRRRNVRGV